jgi:hypothetical protein
MSILSVISIKGSLAVKELKVESKGRQRSTLEAMLGAFLITKDSVDKGDIGKPKSGVTQNTAKKNVANGYAMLAWTKNDYATCISCGYPTLRGFAPEKHRRFDRMLTCSLGCYYNRAHYKETDQFSLETRTVKRVTDSIQAASAYAIKSIRHANCEEVEGGKSTQPAEVSRLNREHLSASFMVVTKYAWNGTKQVGSKCEKKKSSMESFNSLIPNTPVMGHVVPPFMNTKTAKKWSSVLMNSGGKINLDVTQEVDWKQLLPALQGTSAAAIAEDMLDRITIAAMHPASGPAANEVLLLKQQMEALKGEVAKKDAEIRKKDE